ncbi:MAG: hypothetical protein UU12_C0031G0017 [Candidatus Woesebacteria bacterium GW2011_GWA2_40_7b]|uniref:Uncharacterized protein n=1 Tax=Candidatus Woesebacteria bacterium GW2011_GWA2_40_7b TaxID=1618563 RepID=A0A0G0SYZ5_9BACT|nr:MAG: hypothetical protein UU12_C0031G0017 [Candidatus Woesebacteria bacterium GW2011_GWA2_40_7b]
MTIDEKVTVGMVNDSPKYVLWKGRNHTITQIGLHHVFREGKILYHIFSVVADTLFMRLKFDTESLHWTLEETESGF